MKLTYRLMAGRLLAGLACALLMGCGSGADLKETLGLNRQGPDEYRVVPRPPLNVPPEFNLRPPGQESTYVSGKPAQDRAHEAVLGTAPASPATAPTAVTPVTATTLPSGADGQFLADAGAGKADPQIRQQLQGDITNGTAAKDPNYLFGGKKEGDSVVDATKEADRLKQDKQQNLPPTTGDTPVVQPQDKGLLGDIF